MQRTQASTAVCNVVWKNRHALPTTTNVFEQTECTKKQVRSSVAASHLHDFMPCADNAAPLPFAVLWHPINNAFLDDIASRKQLSRQGFRLY